MPFPNREEALKLLQDHVKEDYQILHAKMVAAGLEKYAEKFAEDKDFWFVTGLLHDLDYYEHPTAHPKTGLQWYKEWGYPEEFIHAVAAHGIELPRVKPQSKLAKALIAVDEMCGLFYAYFLMRPTGFAGMEAKSVKKKFKDKAFAAKIDRKEIQYGMDELGVEFAEHVNTLLEAFKEMSELKK